MTLSTSLDADPSKSIFYLQNYSLDTPVCLTSWHLPVPFFNAMTNIK